MVGRALWSSALIATVVGFGGTIGLVVQALRTLGASVDQTASAFVALGAKALWLRKAR